MPSEQEWQLLQDLDDAEVFVRSAVEKATTARDGAADLKLSGARRLAEVRSALDGLFAELCDIHDDIWSSVKDDAPRPQRPYLRLVIPPPDEEDSS